MAVTREQVSEAVMEALVGHDPDSPDGFDAVIEAVLDLLDDESKPVIWEGETRMIMHMDVSLNGTTSYIPLPPEGFDLPPGTGVVIIRTTP